MGKNFTLIKKTLFNYVWCYKRKWEKNGYVHIARPRNWENLEKKLLQSTNAFGRSCEIERQIDEMANV